MTSALLGGRAAVVGGGISHQFPIARQTPGIGVELRRDVGLEPWLRIPALAPADGSRLGRRMRGNSGVYVITASELRRFIELPRRRGRPRKTA
jgi:hypothetical protein